MQKQAEGKKRHYGAHAGNMPGGKEFAEMKQRASLNCSIAMTCLLKRDVGWKMLVQEFGSRELFLVMKSEEFHKMVMEAAKGDRHYLFSGLSDLLLHEKELGECSKEIGLEIRKIINEFAGRAR